MQPFFSSWATSITIAILFSAMVSALLPESGIKKYVNVVLGIVVTLIILSPLFVLFNGADIESEVDDALESITKTYEYEYDSSTYKDYIFDVYEVYMGDE
ncbi:MAG: stage III sporulation protein AF [Eubacteriales bacterium]|nr:stage III sporulation protein AF [Eubacteriales bacterium]